MRRPRNLSLEERHLWQRFARGISPIAPNKHAPLEEFEKLLAPAKPAHKKPVATVPHAHKPHQQPVRPLSPHQQQVNGTVARKLRKGRADIDARIDLHGMRQAEAHATLNDFILTAKDRGHRCVLVITGKGSRGGHHANPYETPGPGVLRTRLKQWVAQEPLTRICYGVEQAHPRHGGSGAFYVFIRKSL